MYIYMQLYVYTCI